MTMREQGLRLGQGRNTEMSVREIFVWGAVGGLFFVAVKAGLFDLQQIESLLADSTRPTLQLSALGIFSGITVVAGAVWAILHRPLRSGFVAVQLGLIAPLAITALVNAADTNLDRLNLDLGPGSSLFISSAYAAEEVARSTPTSGHSTLECIVRSVVKRPC